jgi:predicted nucleic acid-binding protein
LIDKGKLTKQTLTRLMQYLKLPSGSFVTQDLTEEIAQTLQQIPRPTVPEMPDRIIAATALHLNLPLVTKDHKIQALQNIQTIW